MVDVARVLSKPNDVVVVTLGEQGPQGPVGPQGPAGAVVMSFMAGEALGGHRMVKADASGQAVYASNDDEASQHLLGMTLGAAVLGDVVNVQRSGIVVEPSWAWAPNQPVYLSTSGLLTQVYPAGALLVIIVGFALTPTSVHLSPREPIILV